MGGHKRMLGGAAPITPRSDGTGCSLEIQRIKVNIKVI